MNLSDAISHASTIFMPEFLFGADESMLLGERAANEEAIHLLTEEYFANPNPGFEFDLVMELAERNRSICDMMEPETVSGDRDRSRNLASSLSDDDILHGVAALQHRSVEKVAKEVEGMNATRGVLYGSKPAKGTFVGIDIETTSASPDRGYIVNVGWEVMTLEEGAEPTDANSVFCGIPEQYEETGVPLAEVHKITWADVADKKPFREDKDLQKQLLKALKAHPFMAHNAAFEDGWFLLHLDGYAEARKAGKIIPIDTRDICRALDPEVRFLSWEAKPASLEAWAQRRGVLAADEEERHLGLDDTDLMFRTLIAELKERNLLK
ncbi:MAG: 3'-5' exonuclease [Eggerthellaceae bacterium]|nr:3'-5' exonuclease [Eggerthellaceae bacterium]MBQ9042122.1 3'-5' exonuclease [Eggerthellaceae bacterium]